MRTHLGYFRRGFAGIARARRKAVFAGGSARQSDPPRHATPLSTTSPCDTGSCCTRSAVKVNPRTAAIRCTANERLTSGSSGSSSSGSSEGGGVVAASVDDTCVDSCTFVAHVHLTYRPADQSPPLISTSRCAANSSICTLPLALFIFIHHNGRNSTAVQ